MKEIEFNDGLTINTLRISPNGLCVTIDDGDSGLSYIRVDAIDDLIKALRRFQEVNNV